jgi:hypothetical protein
VLFEPSSKQLSSTMSSTTISVTISQGASQDSASSERKRRTAQLCKKCNRISVYVNTHCRKCREEMGMTNPCPSCRKHELKAGYKQCFSCYQKGENEKTGQCKDCSKKIKSGYVKCYACHAGSSSTSRASSSNSFPFINVTSRINE